MARLAISQLAWMFNEVDMHRSSPNNQPHWFVRWAVATAAGLMVGLPWVAGGLDQVQYCPGGTAAFSERWYSFAVLATLLIPPLAVAIFAFGWLGRRAGGDAYPRCDHCGYNLSGLPQPRCPECGR